LQKQNVIDNYVQSEMKRQHIPGLSFAIVKNGEVIHAQGYGLANVELNVAATPETVYHLASISKTFTAMGIMLLIEEGKVRLSDKITRYFDNIPDAWTGITIWHLLTHTSGLVHESKATDEEYWKDTTDQEVIRTAIGAPLRFLPGEQAAYSNLGYQLLGMIMHKVSEKPYAAFLKDRIFTPLGMTATWVYSLSDLIPNRASGYIWIDDVLQNGAYIAPTVIALANGGCFLLF
jgi:D-alanyl-D-alanine carboxypeptidase